MGQSAMIGAMLLLLLATAAVIRAEDAAAAATTAGPHGVVDNPCAGKFKEDLKRINVSERCVASTGLKPEDMPKTEEEFVKDFNDKCYGKCLLTELGMLKGLKFDEDAIKKDIEEHVLDKEFQTRITEYTLKCLHDAQKSPITDDTVCRASAEVLYCCKKEEQKLVC